MKNKKIKLISVLILLIIGLSQISYAVESNNQPAPISIELEDSIKKSTLNELLAGSNNLESVYDLRTVLNNNINVKNQQKTGSCWAFAFTSALETTMANKNNKIGITYSPMHIDYRTSQMFNRSVGTGGNNYLALAYSTSGNGPVYESDFPFSSVYNEISNSSPYYLANVNSVNLDKNTKASVKDATIFPSIYKDYETDSSTGKIKAVTYKKSFGTVGAEKYTEEEVTAARKLIKQHIKENGAISATFYADSLLGLTSDGKYESKYYNSDVNAYCYTSTLSANHAVTIVGWDDTFSKNNFNEQYRPIHDGAYIVLNSWGPNFGDNGYFYVSYDDTSIEQSIFGIVEIEEADQKQYDNIYQYDELGMNQAIGLLNNGNVTNNGYAANVFKRNTSATKYEYLSEVGIYLAATEGVEIYVNPNGDNLSQGYLVGSYTGSNALESGYHTLKLTSPVLLTGDKFTVKVKYINEDGASIPLECNLTESGFVSGINADNYYNTASSNPGESYISADGSKWEDLEGFSFDKYTIKESNVCIKAFSSYLDTIIKTPVTSVTLNKNEEKMEVGDKITLLATINPDYATNKNVTWKSSDEKVAIVENGIITAISEGTATITVTTVDGSYSDSCKITVTKKTNTEDDVYKSEDNDINKPQDNDLSSGTNSASKTNSIKDSTSTSTQGSNSNGTTTILPYTGEKRTMLIIVMLVIGVSIVIFVGYKKMRDIK